VDRREDIEVAHAHVWLIASPNGPFSHGVCRGCGEERDFRNSEPGNGHWMKEKGVNPKYEYRRSPQGMLQRRKI
jgi:hypothetical protein